MVGHTMGTSSVILYVLHTMPGRIAPTQSLCMYNVQMLYIVSYLCTIVGVYSCAVDANQCVRALRRVGCIGATVCEARLNSETPIGTTLLANDSTSEV